MTRRPSPLSDRSAILVQQGKSAREVADLLGISVSTVTRACKRAGVVLKRGRRPATKEKK
jgi:DNA-binding CsgD family transcriptional regulator